MVKGEHKNNSDVKNRIFSKNKSWLLVVGILIIGLILISGCIHIQKPEPEGELKLSDFPEVFKGNALIIIGDNASQIEVEAATQISTLVEKIGNKPTVKKYSELEKNDEMNHNLVVIGTPQNQMFQEVYSKTNATEVTKEYPGENKGVLEILKNPWDEEKAMLLVEGSDEWGAKGSSMMLTEGMIKELHGEMVVTGNFTSVVGRIVIAGNDPFSWPAIEINNTLYGLINRHELMELHGKKVLIEGYLTSSRSPYYPAETNINVVSVRVLP